MFIFREFQTVEELRSEPLTDSIAFVVNRASNESGLSAKQAKALFLNIRIYTHGIACSVYNGSIVMTEEEEKNLLFNAFYAFKEYYERQPTV